VPAAALARARRALAPGAALGRPLRAALGGRLGPRRRCTALHWCTALRWHAALLRDYSRRRFAPRRSCASLWDYGARSRFGTRTAARSALRCARAAPAGSPPEAIGSVLRLATAFRLAPRLGLATPLGLASGRRYTSSRSDIRRCSARWRSGWP